MSEIDEETIARAILHEEYGCAPEDVPNLYGKALATARLVMALVLPAIERARVEERERCAKKAEAINFGPPEGGTMSAEYRDGHSDGTDVAQALIAAAIRKG